MAKIFSTIDSVKRILGDALLNPAAFAQTAGAAVLPMTAETAMNFGPGNIGGMIVPAVRKFGPGLVADLQAQLAAKRANPREIAQTADVFNVPHDAVLRTVISDLGAKLRVDPAARIPANVTLQDVLSHGELYRLVPNLKSIPVTPLSPNSPSRASTYPGVNHPIGTIGVRPTTSGEDFLSSLLHETQHGSDLLAKLQAGGSPRQFLQNPEGLRAAIPKATTAAKDSMVSGVSDATTDRLITEANTLIRAQRGAVHAYKQIPGEVVARIVQQMRSTGQDKAVDALDLLQLPEFTMALRPTSTKFDADPLVRSLIKKYSTP